MKSYLILSSGVSRIWLWGGQNIFDTRGVHKVSFPFVPQLLNLLLREATACKLRDRVVTSYDACISGTSRVPTVASFQRLKMEALISAPAECEVLSMIKILNAQSK